MDDPTALDYWTLAIAVVGLLTGVAALVAQVWSVRLSGPHVKVRVSDAISGDGQRHLGLDASNVGRLPVTLVDYGVAFRLGGRTKTMSLALMHGSQWTGVPLGPHRLPDAEALTWMINPQHVARVVTAEGVREVRGYVRLATGRLVLSRNRIDVVDLASVD